MNAFTPKCKKAPGANGDPNNTCAAGGYSPFPVDATPALERLTPQRRQNAERLLEYVAWHGGKVYLYPPRLADIRRDWRTRGMDSHDSRHAADDLHHLGLARVSIRPDVTIIQLLTIPATCAPSIPVTTTTTNPSPTPTFALAPARRGART